MDWTACMEMHRIPLHCVALHYIVLHCHWLEEEKTLCCIALHGLHYTAGESAWVPQSAQLEPRWCGHTDYLLSSLSPHNRHHPHLPIELLLSLLHCALLHRSLLIVNSVYATVDGNCALWGNSRHVGMQWKDQALLNRPRASQPSPRTPCLASIWSTTLNTWGEAVKHLAARFYNVLGAFGARC